MSILNETFLKAWIYIPKGLKIPRSFIPKANNALTYIPFILNHTGLLITYPRRSQKHGASPNISSDGRKLTSKLKNSVGMAVKTFEVNLLDSVLNVGIYADMALSPLQSS